MGDRSLESAGLPSRVSSHANLSLFDDEILFDDDPNRAYFNFMVGIDNLDKSLVGDSTLEDARDSHQPSKGVQQRWMNMGESKGTLEYPNYSGPNTLEDGSLPRSLNEGSLHRDIESAVPRDDMEMAVMKRFSRDANVPPVIYVGQESGAATQTKEQKLKQEKVIMPWAFDDTGTSTQPKNKELKQEKAIVPGAFDYSPRPEGSFLWKNRRKILVGLSLCLLAMVVLVVALIFTGQSSVDDDATDTSVSAKGAAADGVPSTSPSAIPTQVKTSPVPSDYTAGSATAPTTAPSTSSSESPTDSPTASLSMSAIPSTSSSESSTDSPVASFSMNLQDLIEFLSLVSPDGGAALSNPSSPQYYAAEWLSEEPLFVSYSERKKLQRYTLATLYFATNGGQWTSSNGWLTDADECDWYTTNDEICSDGTLQILDLESNNLQGWLPLELTLLSDTLGESWRILLLIPSSGISPTNRLSTSERFDVGDNNLSGTIPPVFGLLTGLSKISLKRNKVVGSIPSEFGLLKKLRNLALNDNQLTGTVPTELLQLSDLEELALDSNNLTGVIDNGACNLSTLKADCDKVECECCTSCCYDTDGCT